MDRQLFIDKILEAENLTDQLEDEDADALLNWGITKVDGLIDGIKDEEAAGGKINDLMHVMRGLNSLAGSPSDISHAGLADLLNRYNKITAGTAESDELERSSLAEKISNQPPGEAVRLLTEWLQSKK
jgi:hypothetical protein